LRRFGLASGSFYDRGFDVRRVRSNGIRSLIKSAVDGLNVAL
jgi:hypothetical protein